MTDTLSINQVLVEELKVKDRIIEASETLNKSKNDTNTINVEDESDKEENTTGQCICDVCQSVFKTKNEMNNHKEKEHTQQKFTCIHCDKNFKAEASFKQHLNALHKRNEFLPVGHPGRIQLNNRQNIACYECDERFETGTDLSKHMEIHVAGTSMNIASDTEKGYRNTRIEKTCRYFRKGFCAKGSQCRFKHEKCDERVSRGKDLERHMTASEAETKSNYEGFKRSRAEIICRYYRRGFCEKGNQCLFKHEKTQRNSTPACNRGVECRYLYQKRCRYFHQGVGVQNQEQKECRYKNECRNQSKCPFAHPVQYFRFTQRTVRPPQGTHVRNMEIWRE